MTFGTIDGRRMLGLLSVLDPIAFGPCVGLVLAGRKRGALAIVLCTNRGPLLELEEP